MLNVKEFQEYINSFHKEKGQYTLEELMQIGVKFKELPVKQRNWKTLHQLLGVYGFSSEAYRHRVDNYIKRKNIILNPEQEGEIYKNDYIEQQKVRDWYNAYRRDIREEARIQNLKDEIERAADKFSKLEISKWVRHQYKVDDRFEGKVEATLLLSDLHIGVDCDNYYNKYNIEIAAQRLSLLADKVIKYCDRNHVNTLHILNLGDMIQGLIHTNARIEAQMDVAEQVMVAGELISTFMAKVCAAAPNITYRSVYDNHSRAIASKDEHIEKEQFSRIIDWFIQERLKKSTIQFIENEIDGGIGSLEVCGKKLLFAHGHQDSKNASMQNFVGLTREWVDYVCLAHYHNPASKDFQGCKVFINGSIVGTESYAFGKRLFTKPSQKLLIFSLGNEDIQDIDISLE